MGGILFAEDLAERYRVSVRKAKEMLLSMPALNVGTDKRKRLAVSEAALEAWERERSEVRGGYMPAGQRPRIRMATPTGTEGLVCPKRPKRK